MSKIALSIVLPCYNEAASLPALVLGYKRALETARFEAAAFELLLVDNGSTDDTWEVLDGIFASREYPFLTRVALSQNRGYGGGILAGLELAQGDTLGFSHADEQCPPEDVFTAWAELRRSAGGALASGMLVKGERLGRSLGAWLFSRAFELCGLALLRRRLYEVNAQPKLFPRALLDAIRTDAPDHFAFDLHVLLRAREAGYAIRTIPVHFGVRAHGESRWSSTLRSRVRHSRALLRFMRAYREIPRPARPEKKKRVSHGR